MSVADSSHGKPFGESVYLAGPSSMGKSTYSNKLVAKGWLHLERDQKFIVKVIGGIHAANEYAKSLLIVKDCLDPNSDNKALFCDWGRFLHIRIRYADMQEPIISTSNVVWFGATLWIGTRHSNVDNVLIISRLSETWRRECQGVTGSRSRRNS